MSSRSAVLGGFAVWLFIASCHHEFDTTRPETERQSLGAEIYKVFCQRIASDELPHDVSGRQTLDLCEGRVGPESAPTTRLAVLASHRNRVVAALDSTLPEHTQDDLQNFMVQIIPFYDPPEEALPAQTRAIGDMLAKITADPEAISALERLSVRTGYRPLRLALGLARPALSYPELVPLSQTLLRVIDEEGPAGPAWEALLEALAVEFATATVSPASNEKSTLELARELLLQEDAAFGNGRVSYMALRDRRGLAQTAGGVRAPFVDANGDGLADIGPLGEFVGLGGTALHVPTPFAVLNEFGVTRDAHGRAMGADGLAIYEYRNVNATMLAGLIRESRPWLNPATPTLMDMAYGVPVLMGPRMRRNERIGATTFSYEGFDTAQSPLIDLVHAAGPLLEHQATDDVLALTEILLRDHEPLLTKLIDSALFADALGDAHPSAQLATNSELWDDLMQAARFIAQEPGLMEGLLRALTDPRTRRLGQIYSEMMNHRDEVGPDPVNFSRPRRDQPWTLPVDHNAPDSTGNMSIFQRTISIIHDLDGVRICNKPGARVTLDGPGGVDVTVPFIEFGECELMELTNITEAYVQAILGRYEIVIKNGFLNTLLNASEWVGLGPDRFLEDQSGIVGLTTHPTPEALNRLLFGEWGPFLNSTLNRPLTRDGVPVHERHDPIVFAWERSFRFCGEELVEGPTPCASPEEVGFFQAMTPLLTAFDDHDRRTASRFLFGTMISALHTHWPSQANAMTQDDNPSAPFFANQDNGRSYEPIVADLFAGCVWDRNGAGRRCNQVGAGEMIQRLHELALVLDNIEVRPGIDGISALASASEAMMDPDRNAGLTDYRGSGQTRTNNGTRAPRVSPMYLLVDALTGMDRAFAEADPSHHQRWLAGRSRIVDQMLAMESVAGEKRLSNRTMVTILQRVVPFLRARIADHRTRGDLSRWARGLSARVDASVGSAVGAAAVQLMDAVNSDVAARDELSRFLLYTLDENAPFDAYETTLLSVADLLQLLDDDANILPITRVLSEAMAPNVRELIATQTAVSGEDLSLNGSALDESLDLLERLNQVDERRVLPTILSAAVQPTPSGETPVEILLDVVAEVNRTAPGVGGPMNAEDHRAVFGTATEFLLDEGRGLERIYDVVQARHVSP